MTRTKILCTIGPASHDEETITAMVEAGMSAARLNFSHGSHKDHGELIATIRRVSEKTGHPITIIQDLQGPKIRVGDLGKKGRVLTDGETVKFDTAPTPESGTIPIDFHELHSYVATGERLLIDDGRVECTVSQVDGTVISAQVVHGGTIISHKGVNVPDSKLLVRSLTEKDKTDLVFGVAQGVDMVAVSFVQSPDDILDVKYAIEAEVNKEDGQPPIRIIAKIERPQAVDRIEEILGVADGIMIARGDLGIEIPAAEVPLTQKKLIDAALAVAKPVIVATQMLDSMQTEPRPTRAEVSDVANAVIDHADAVMLSNETATGKYPIEAVRTMHAIIAETEASAYDDLPVDAVKDTHVEVDDVITQMSRVLAQDVGAVAIVAASLSGDTARLISRHRPELPVVVTTNTERVRRQMNLSWGIIPYLLDNCRTVEELIDRSVVVLKREHLVKPGDTIVVVAGEPVGQAGHVNLLEVRKVG